ncbi:hypothetical protein [Scytonema sp. NUACC26]|uniref:hypothetical protein n=1 Tax=Scytonema sp. NUACC26 TaxID=3140176 RepID=UPI0034DC42BC
MRAIISDIPILSHLQPERVEAYLLHNGWHQRNRIPDKVSIWTRESYSEDKLKIQLPLDPKFDDYPLRMSEIMEILERAENRSQLDILSELITLVGNTEIQGLVTQAQSNTEGEGGNVTILGVVMDKLQKIHIHLGEPEYSVARQAYTERLPIVCTGDLIREDSSFTLKNLQNFSLMFDTQI